MVERDDAQSPPPDLLLVERVQTGVRMEKRLLKVLKGLAELLDMSLGDLLEGIVLHAFEGRAPFSPETLGRIAELKRIYGLDLGASASHRLIETGGGAAAARASGHGSAAGESKPPKPPKTARDAKAGKGRRRDALSR
jgi:hypothetical protein